MQMAIIEPTAAPEMKRRIRVGAYCPVSTDASDQKHSFNAQKMHFSMLYANSAEIMITIMEGLAQENPHPSPAMSAGA